MFPTVLWAFFCTYECIRGGSYTLIFQSASEICSNHKKKHTQHLELACCHRASTTAQPSAISHTQSSESRTWRSECDNASKRTVSESQHVVEHLSAVRCSQNQEIEICPSEKYMQPQAAGNSRRICLYLFPISIRYKTLLHVCTMHACGVRVVFLEHGALGIYLQVVGWHLILDLSVRFIHGVLFYYFLVSERRAL